MEILLEQGEMLVFDRNRRERQVVCREGLLWITQAGDPRDHLLRDGGRFVSKTRGRIVVTARTPSRLVMGSPERRAYKCGLGSAWGWHLAG